MRSSRLPLGIIFCIGLLWFLPLGVRDLIRSDEGRYAELAREMWISGDWTTPRLNGIKYFEKPPLQYWATALFYSVFGPSAWTARLWPALTGFSGLLLSLWFGLRFVSVPLAWLVVGVQASTLWYVGVAHFNVLDMGLCFFLQLTLFGYLLRIRADEARTLSAWMMGIGIAGAILSKGLIGIVLPGLVFILDSLWHRDARPWKANFQAYVWSIALSIALPWFIAVSLKNPEFARFFFIHEHFERFTASGHHREGPIYYFIPILLLGLLPWTLIWLKSLKDWKEIVLSPLNQGGRTPWIKELQSVDPLDSNQNRRLQRVLIIWSMLIFVFFSVSRSKLPSYILPIFPALSWLIAFSLAKHHPRHWRMPLAASVMLWVGIIAILPIVPKWLTDQLTRDLYQGYLPYILSSAVLMIAGCIGLLARERYSSEDSFFKVKLWGGAVIIWSIAIELVLQGHQVFSPRQSIRPLVDQVVKNYGVFRQDIPFYSVDMYEQTLPFYIYRTTTLVHLFDEMEFGCGQEPGRCIKTIEDWRLRWLNEPKNAYAIIPPRLYEELGQSGLPMRVLGQNSRSVIVIRH